MNVKRGGSKVEKGKSRPAKVNRECEGWVDEEEDDDSPRRGCSLTTRVGRDLNLRGRQSVGGISSLTRWWRGHV